jgi:Protein of unknown function (DUF3551)
MIRALAIAAILATGALLLAQGSAQAGRWCAEYSYRATNCGFHSYQQCRAAISGAGGVCYRG